jgi:RimJ/RimL family protein N-acetyltransferase
LSLLLTGERVTLRPIRPDELELFASGSGRSVTQERLQERIERSGRFVEGMLDLGVDVDGTLVGDVQARRPVEAVPPGVVELGVDLYDSADRGRGYGREAVALLTTHLFAKGIAERVQGSTAVDNVAMRTVFERLGYRFEGVMRGFMPAPDGREDYALYAVLRAEWPGS